MKSKTLAKMKVALELISEGYQMMSESLRQAEIDELSEKVDDTKPLKKSSTRKKSDKPA